MGACTIDPASRWDVIVIDAELFEDDVAGEAWDPFGGLPDAYVALRADDSPETYTGQTSVIDDTLTPFWSETVLADIPARGLLTGGLQTRVADDDAGTDDDMGTCNFSIDVSMFDDTAELLECGRDDGATRRGYSVRVRIRQH
jgi:hypothetical protein